jgi:hypothetical protein
MTKAYLHFECVCHGTVSQCLAKDTILSGLVKTLRLEDEAEISITHEGEKPIGTVILHFVATYCRQAFQLNANYNC